MRRERRATPLELALWRHMVRDVRPLTTLAEDVAAAASAPAAAPDEPPPAKPRPSGARLATAGKPRPAAAPILPSSVNLDRRTWQRLQRGQVPISGRLDLHGLTQAEAHRLLVEFVLDQQAKGSRCVLVITGRGLRTGGVLKGETPRWLAAPPLAGTVLAFAPARISHGGDGALYVLLRRKRDG